jgi:hypothetical protein
MLESPFRRRYVRGDSRDAPQLARRMLRSYPRVSNRYTVLIDIMISAMLALVGGQVSDILPQSSIVATHLAFWNPSSCS